MLKSLRREDTYLKSYKRAITHLSLIPEEGRAEGGNREGLPHTPAPVPSTSAKQYPGMRISKSCFSKKNQAPCFVHWVKGWNDEVKVMIRAQNLIFNNTDASDLLATCS